MPLPEAIHPASRPHSGTPHWRDETALFLCQVHGNPCLPGGRGRSLSRSSCQGRVRVRCQVRVIMTVSPHCPGPGTDCLPRAGDGHTGIRASGTLLLEENEIFIKDIQGFVLVGIPQAQSPLRNDSGWLWGGAVLETGAGLGPHASRLAPHFSRDMPPAPPPLAVALLTSLRSSARSLRPRRLQNRNSPRASARGEQGEGCRQHGSLRASRKLRFMAYKALPHSFGHLKGAPGVTAAPGRVTRLTR